MEQDEKRAEAPAVRTPPPGFELTADTLTVLVVDETTGTKYELQQTFRQPSEKEWVEYMRSASGWRVVAGKVEEGDQTTAELKLWNACVLSVDDRYLWQGQPVTQQKDWKAKIRTSHKLAAVRALLAVRHQVVDGPLA